MSTKKLSPCQKDLIRKISKRLQKFDEVTLDSIDDLVISLSVMHTGKMIIKLVDGLSQPNAADLKAKRESYATITKWDKWTKRDLEKIVENIKGS
jgi:hypothetical protein